MRPLVDRGHASLTIRRQCELLGLARSTLYYEPATESSRNLALMRLIDEEFLRHPFYGSRQMTAWLNRTGHGVNRKRVQRLMQLMGIEAVYPKRRTSLPAAENRVFPYLLRGVPIKHPHHVWSTDITYVPLRRGFMYLVAVMDWYSRFVLSWRLSNSLETSFCLDALEDAFIWGQPEIFNTDQGAQFTSAAFTSRLLAAGVAISMAGRGRALDNVFIERLWRTVKYENVYLKDYETVDELYEGLLEYFAFYNRERSHQSLAGRTPWETYQAGQSGHN